MPTPAGRTTGQAEFLQGDIVSKFLHKVPVEGFYYQSAAMVAAKITRGPICTWFSRHFGCTKPPTRDPTSCPKDPVP